MICTSCGVLVVKMLMIRNDFILVPVLMNGVSNFNLQNPISSFSKIVLLLHLFYYSTSFFNHYNLENSYYYYYYYLKFV